jgi:hypothetical protein
MEEIQTQHHQYGKRNRRYLVMRKVLAVIIVLMFAVIVLSPTMGYSVQSGNHSYSFRATRVNYTIGSQAPSHEPAVQVTRVPFSLKYVSAVQPTEPIGATTKGNITVPVGSANVTAPIKAAITPALPTVAQKLLIQGMVYDDQNGNGKLDRNETGLANWTINLEQPPGNVISKATTNNDGTYGFYSLVPGAYTVVENLEMGWNLTTPSEGKYAVNLTSNTNMLNFGNKMMAAPKQNMTAPANSTLLANGIMPVNATSPK